MNSISKELARNTFIISIGKLSTKFISFFLLPLYTSILNTESYGTIDIILTYVSLILPLLTLQLETASFRFLIDVRNNKKKTEAIISNLFICISISILVFLLIYYILNIYINIPYKKYFLYLVITSIISSNFLEMVRGLGNNVIYSFSSLLIGGFTIVLNVLFLVVMKFGPSSILLSQIISNVLGIIFIYWKVLSKNKINIKYFDKNLIKEYLKYTIPLVPNAIIWWIITASDRSIIAYFLGISANGIYVVSNKFSNMIISLYSIFQLSWTQTVCTYANDNSNNEYVSKTMESVLRFVFSFCLIIISSTPFIFSLLISKSFSEARLYVPILVIGCFFDVISQLLSSIYLSFKRTKEVFKSSLISCFINVVFNLLFINKIGLYAAAISTLLSYLSISLYRIINIKKIFNVNFPIKFFVCSIICFAFSLILFYENSIFTTILNIMFAVIVSIYFNRVTLSNLYRKIKLR